MKIDNLTVVIPTKNGKYLKEFIKEMEWLLNSVTVIVIDSGGGELFKKFADVYIQKDVSMREARMIGYKNVKTDLILNLDDDTIIPIEFIINGIKMFIDNNVGAVTIDYEKSQGHYIFGASIWNTEVLLELYNFPEIITKLVEVEPQKWLTMSNRPYCECLFMWSKLRLANKKLVPLSYKAKHLRSK